ncbi:MAG: helix-turn-helix transcriptional regulator [Clostridia bacterium]|nr:helix-turn-helix transcriptional regulator [Clostridia bacterium]
MEFIPIDFEREAPNGEKYIALLPDHIILKQRRLELNMTQQQVADEAGILLRQYHRVEKGERSITGTSARILLSVCAVLRIDPYDFFPDIKQKDIIPKSDEKQGGKLTVIEPTIKKSKYIPFLEYKELMCKVPRGMVVTRNSIDEYFCKKYNVEVVAIDERYSIVEQINKTYPYWREVGGNGVLYMTTRLHSRDEQERLLKEEGVEIIPWGENNRSLRVKDFKKYFFDLNSLL